jgi:hypothetical protein
MAALADGSHIQWFGRAAVDSSLNFLAQFFKAGVLLAILLFQEAERFFHHFTGGAITAGGDFAADHFFIRVGDLDIHGHKTSWRGAHPRKIANLGLTQKTLGTATSSVLLGK